MAMVRFSLIAPAVNGTFSEPSKAAYYRAVSGKDVPLPGGGTARFNPNTLKWWERQYRLHGFEGLVLRGGRSDSGDVRALTDEQVRQVEGLRDEFPRLSATGLRRKMVELGLMGEGDASVSTFQRYVANHPRTRAEATGGDTKERRAFEAENPGDLWQADTLHGPYVVVDDAGHRGRAYLQMILDDRTRVIVSGRFWASDNGENFQRTLRRGIEVWGLPSALYVDNGGPYRNKQLTGICGRLGIVLRHTDVRDGAAKGKVERNFRTVRSRLLAAIEDDPDRTLEGLNDLLANYITTHNGTPHSALGGRTPMSVWEEQTALAPLRAPESGAWLDERFLNRVTRKVNKDATVMLGRVLYDVPQHLVGSRVEVLYTPGKPGDVWVAGEGGARVRVAPTDKAANGRMPREGRRYRIEWSEGGGDR